MQVEPYAQDRLEDNLTPIGRLYYAVSIMLCCAHAISQEGNHVPGAQAGEARLSDILRKAGFGCFGRDVVQSHPRSAALTSRCDGEGDRRTDQTTHGGATRCRHRRAGTGLERRNRNEQVSDSLSPYQARARRIIPASRE
ncbi:hypothetical protein [Salipiger mucosus]|uniref:hypothetical protein n=1 Tax=Salipiger mucosus TaxID=263378 RepID=UPI000A06D8F9|nr:hypothetical protein [Salipiger mucosus]